MKPHEADAVRQVLAYEAAGGLPLYACEAPGCKRFTREQYCCIWCEYSKTFGKPLRRHTSRCEYRQGNVVVGDDRHVITDECRPAPHSR